MVFNTGATLLDAIVLAVVSQETEGTYGYRITQEVQEVLGVSDSTLYAWRYMTGNVQGETADTTS